MSNDGFALDKEAMQALVFKAIVESMDSEKRDALVTDAIAPWPAVWTSTHS